MSVCAYITPGHCPLNVQKLWLRLLWYKDKSIDLPGRKYHTLQEIYNWYFMPSTLGA